MNYLIRPGDAQLIPLSQCVCVAFHCALIYQRLHKLLVNSMCNVCFSGFSWYDFSCVFHSFFFTVYIHVVIVIATLSSLYYKYPDSPGICLSVSQTSQHINSEGAHKQLNWSLCRMRSFFKLQLCGGGAHPLLLLLFPSDSHQA